MKKFINAVILSSLFLNTVPALADTTLEEQLTYDQNILEDLETETNDLLEDSQEEIAEISFENPSEEIAENTSVNLTYDLPENTERIVNLTIGSTEAYVNGNLEPLTIAPYIQNPSESMMIPLRFVSTALGIDESNIVFTPETKEITITYKDKVIVFAANKSTMQIDGKIFDMAMTNTTTNKKELVYTEIKDGSTFIPLRAFEASLNFNIEWDNLTKTATMINTMQDTETVNKVYPEQQETETYRYNPEEDPYATTKLVSISHEYNLDTGDIITSKEEIVYTYNPYEN